MIEAKRQNWARLRRAIGAASLLAAIAGPAAAAPPAGFDEDVASILKVLDVPGVSVAIVEDGKPVLTKGYGVRTLGKSEPVDAHTLFAIGSCSKAFTAAALALLVDDGKIRWDDPVTKHLPDFQLSDPYVTHEMTVRDLLVHRSGLGAYAGDLLVMPPSTYTRDEIVHRLRGLKLATSFRSSYAYDNVLYIVAGQLIEKVSGQSWEKFIEARIFAPLGMKESDTSVSVMEKQPNRAAPHTSFDGEVMGAGKLKALDKMMPLGAAAPAGAINSNATDMARWLQTQLAGGALPEGNARLYSAASAEAMWTPETIMPIKKYTGALAKLTPQFHNYALGWNVKDYQGHKIVQHSGGVLGQAALVVLLPEKKTGFVILSNTDGGVATQAIAYRLADHYLGLPANDWAAAYRARIDERNADAKATLAKAKEVRAAKSNPSLELARYAGKFEDSWYGTMTIAEKGGKLEIRLDATPDAVGTLEHFQYDTFRTHWKDPTIEDAYVTFQLKADGSIDQIKLAAVSPLADPSFDYQDLLFRPVPASTVPTR